MHGVAGGGGGGVQARCPVLPCLSTSVHWTAPAPAPANPLLSPPLGCKGLTSSGMQAPFTKVGQPVGKPSQLPKVERKGGGGWKSPDGPVCACRGRRRRVRGGGQDGCQWPIIHPLCGARRRLASERVAPREGGRLEWRASVLLLLLLPGLACQPMWS